MHIQSRKLNALHIYLFLTATAAFAMGTIFSINMVYQIEMVKLNPLQLVLVGTTLELACFLFQIPTGVLADVYSRRLSVIIGYLLIGIGFLVEGLFPNFVVVLIAQVLWGCGITFVNGAEEAWIAEEVGEEKVGDVFIRGTQLGTIASILCIPLSIWLATFQLNIPVITGSLFLIGLAVFLFFFMPENNFQPTIEGERNSWHVMGKTMADGFSAVRKSRMLLLILGVTACAAMASEGFDRLQTAHFIDNFAFPQLGNLSQLTWFGIIGVGSHFLTLGASEIVRRKVNTNNHMRIITVLMVFDLLLVLSVACFALAGNFLFALVAFWSASIFRRAGQPLYTTWVTRNSEPKMRATVISMLGQVDAIGQIAGGPGVGYIGTTISLRAALLTTSAILAPGVVFYLRALKISKEEPTFAHKDAEQEEIVPVTGA